MNAKGIRFILAGLAAALALSPAVAQAQSPVAMVVMYEVNEGLAFFKGMKGATGPGDFRQRVARASLLGRDVRPLGTASPFAVGSFIQADALSTVDVQTGHGPIQGYFTLLADLDPSRNSLDTLEATAIGTVNGDLDLASAGQGFAPVSGRWTLSGTGQGGTFAGLFLIPFRVPGETRYFYLDRGPSGQGGLCGSKTGTCPLADDEFVLGIPLTKAVVVFFE
ncbi:MAG: hypothetical protein DMF81_05060 [Acidobacteria bacterium]|nr:MAG: hypothetical protein DMF81_05060 [Acidobacteriota bacterium]